MKTVKDKYLVVGADFAGFPLKEVVVEHLTKKGWKILVKRAMESDNSWGKSANEYIKMYKEIIKG